jgi:hypothetical protein
VKVVESATQTTNGQLASRSCAVAEAGADIGGLVGVVDDAVGEQRPFADGATRSAF